jgi:hypothetical protein
MSPIAQKVFITTTGSATYKLRWLTSSNTAVIYNNGSLGVLESGNSKISWKKIGGFLPIVGGTTVDTVSVNLTGSNQSIPAVNTDVIFNTLAYGNIPYNTSTGVFTLTAGKTYELEATLKSRGTTAGYIQYEWVDATSGTAITGGINGVDMHAPSTLVEGISPRAYLMYTPVTNQTVKVRVTGISGTALFLDSSRCNANIKQLGTTAWTGLNVTTTGTGNNASTYNSGTSTLNIPNLINDQNASGYIDIGSVRMQWGLATTGASTVVVNMPVAFLNTNYSLTMTPRGTSGFVEAANAAINSTSQFGFNGMYQNGGVAAFNTGRVYSWLAIGQKP